MVGMASISIPVKQAPDTFFCPASEINDKEKSAKSVQHVSLCVKEFHAVEQIIRKSPKLSGKITIYYPDISFEICKRGVFHKK